MRIVVVGPGAIGSLFAALLSEGGHEVALLGHRAGPVSVINAKGLTVLREGTLRTVPVRATTRASELGTPDLVLMCVKAYATRQASADVAPAVGANTAVLTLQNGLGNVETMASVFGQEKVLAGVTSHGATLLTPGLVRHAGEGETALGELDGRETDRLRAVVEGFRQAGVRVQVSQAVRSLIWGKVVVNCAINPLTAILRVENGKLLASERARELMAAAALEAVAVARVLGIEVPYGDPVARAEEVARLTAANRSSMFQDVRRRKRTEIDYISGAVAKLGDEAGVPTPVNRTLAQLVGAIEGR